jgi:outer membrane lipoprotein-sorting protein
MRSRALVLAAASALLCLPVAAQPAPLTTADEVIAQNLAARGGKDKILAVQSARITGKMMIGPGMEAPVTMEWKAPNRVRMEFVVQGQTGVQAFDGSNAWMHMPFMGKADPEPMPAEQANDIEQQADFPGPLVDYQTKGHQVELLGREDVEGTDAYKLRITLKSGDVITEYIDAESFLSIRMEGRSKRGDQEIETETSIGNYKQVGDLLLPHSMETRMKGAPANAPAQSITIEGYELGATIDDGRFTMPAKPAAGN